MSDDKAPVGRHIDVTSLMEDLYSVCNDSDKQTYANRTVRRFCYRAADALAALQERAKRAEAALLASERHNDVLTGDIAAAEAALAALQEQLEFVNKENHALRVCLDAERKETADVLGIAESRVKALEEQAGLTWFWSIVDADGLNNVASDERTALRKLVKAASRATAAEARAKALEAFVASIACPCGSACNNDPDLHCHARTALRSYSHEQGR